jgi:hypothetical protein
MAVLVAAIHVFLATPIAAEAKAWMRGPDPRNKSEDAQDA